MGKKNQNRLMKRLTPEQLVEATNQGRRQGARERLLELGFAVKERVPDDKKKYSRRKGRRRRDDY